MRPRAIRNLCQLTNDDFFQKVGEGMKLCCVNANRFLEDSLLLSKNGRNISARILYGSAREEAAKFLILLDAIRCPRNSQDRISKHLGKFHDHLAKLIYAEYYESYPESFEEVLRIIEHRRAEYYLDGPSGVDFIFRNLDLTLRERNLYVDYVEWEKGNSDWVSPDNSTTALLVNKNCRVVNLVNSLANTRFCELASLKIIAKYWHRIDVKEDYKEHWSEYQRKNVETLELLKVADNGGIPEGSVEEIIERWCYPLYSVDLSIQDNLKNMQEIQNNWIPD